MNFRLRRARVDPAASKPLARTSPAHLGKSLWIGFGSSALFLWLALRNVDFAELANTLANANGWAGVPFCLALAAFFWLKAERWRLLIRTEHDVTSLRLVGPMMIGFAANNVLPLRAGELVRVHTAGRVLDMSRTELLASLIVERILDALSVAVLTASAVALLQFEDATLIGGVSLLGPAIVALVVSSGVLLLLLGLIGKDLSMLVRFAPVRFRGRAASLLDRFVAGLEPLAQRGVAVPALLLSLAQWFLLAVCVHLACVAVGLELRSIPVSMVVLGLVVLGISVPSAPAYVGTIEYAFVVGLGLFGVTASGALAAALFYHGLMFVGVTMAGAVCWTRYASRQRGSGSLLDRRERHEGIAARSPETAISSEHGER